MGWPPTGKVLKGSFMSRGRHMYPRAITASSTCTWHSASCSSVAPIAPRITPEKQLYEPKEIHHRKPQQHSDWRQERQR
jgi:hypothetical protein